MPNYYARRGRALVLGWDPESVALSLEGRGLQGADLKDHPRALAAPRREGRVSSIGLLSGRQWLAQTVRLLAEREECPAEVTRTMNYLREMSTPMATMPPTVFSLKRQPSGARLEVRQTDLRAASTTVIDILLTWLTEEPGPRCERGRYRIVPSEPPANLGPARGALTPSTGRR
jgi:hypothetical protein